MKVKRRKLFFVGVGLLAVFVIWTLSARFVDVLAIGPQGTKVGFASFNRYVHGITGVNMSLYRITDWLGLVPIGIAFGFSFLGLIQLFKRKSLFKVDRSILMLGGFYFAVVAVYVIFELLVINYRPVLIDGRLEASYPSSTTMLAMCVVPTAIMQLCERIKSRVVRCCALITAAAFTAFMVLGRILSGVHWISDIIGGALISAALVTIYYSVSKDIDKV